MAAAAPPKPKRSDELADFYASVIITAVEGGIGYWARTYGYDWNDADPAKGVQASASGKIVDHYEAAEILDVDGMQWNYDWLDVPVEADDERLAKITWQVNPDAIAKAFTRLNKGSAAEAAADVKVHESYVRRFREAYREKDGGLIDSIDADIIVQIATLGSVVYG